MIILTIILYDKYLLYFAPKYPIFVNIYRHNIKLYYYEKKISSMLDAVVLHFSIPAQ